MQTRTNNSNNCKTPPGGRPQFTRRAQKAATEPDGTAYERKTLTRKRTHMHTRTTPSRARVWRVHPFMHACMPRIRAMWCATGSYAWAWAWACACVWAWPRMGVRVGGRNTTLLHAFARSRSHTSAHAHSRTHTLARASMHARTHARTHSGVLPRLCRHRPAAVAVRPNTQIANERTNEQAHERTNVQLNARTNVCTNKQTHA